VRRLRGYENFTLPEFLTRISLVQYHNCVASRRAGEFIWTAHQKHFAWDELHHPAQPLPLALKESDLLETLGAARNHAHEDLDHLGVPPPINSLPPPVVLDWEIPDDDSDLSEKQLSFIDADVADLIPPLPFPPDEEDGDTLFQALKSGDFDILRREAAAAAAQARPPRQGPAHLLPTCFSPRQALFPSQHISKMLVSSSGKAFNKLALCAALSGHPKSSKDRVIRVQGM